MNEATSVSIEIAKNMPAIIIAITALVTALVTGVISVLTLRAQQRNSVAIADARQGITEIKVATDGLTDKLVAAAEKSSHAEGKAEGITAMVEAGAAAGATILIGAPGEEGDVGPQGPEGKQGPAGKQGPKGAKGVTTLR